MGMDFLVKLHPKPNWMFNQVADDRDHMSMRMPGMDNFYGRGYELAGIFFVQDCHSNVANL